MINDIENVRTRYSESLYSQSVMQRDKIVTGTMAMIRQTGIGHHRPVDDLQAHLLWFEEE